MKTTITLWLFMVIFMNLSGQERDSILLKIDGSAPTPESLVQAQVEGYNARDIEAFLEPYAEEVEIYNFPDQISGMGKENIKPGYEAMFANLPELHCEIVNRIVLGNTVIDQERITGIPNRPIAEAIAIYKIENNKIAKVYFIPKE